jgi:sulfoxide reductase heme-binding subunit YedZ
MVAPSGGHDPSVSRPALAWLATPWVRGLVALLALLPLADLGVDVLLTQSAPDPVEEVIQVTGVWALRLLLVTLSLTPLRVLTGASAWIRHRRLLGLMAFLYAFLHASAWGWLLCEGSVSRMTADILKHPYVLAGMGAFLAMVPLAVTSTRGWQRRLRHRWLALHRLVYPLTIAALVHFTWQEKLGLSATWGYALVLALLLGFRVVQRWRRRSVQTQV